MINKKEAFQLSNFFLLLLFHLSIFLLSSSYFFHTLTWCFSLHQWLLLVYSQISLLSTWKKVNIEIQNTFSVFVILCFESDIIFDFVAGF